ncbi:hypothetical protein GP486_000507 [Trichoglossum hirsutum]|uniref:Uncharacterized protein n=1 Tax=Trichoglossum hirsutum TaxID=265104 RepID=A0A9P8LIF1_9PEZI|nr:hypothetical protein GP486_000507 [Trichoglossum hirsutum]
MPSSCNVDRSVGSSPISAGATELEMRIEMILDRDPSATQTVFHEWFTYLDRVLSESMGREVVKILAKAFADHTVDKPTRGIIAVAGKC